MKELLEYIVKSIVNNPDDVVIEERESVDFPGLTILNVSVAEDDKGIIIGKRGRTINAIRDIMSINAIRSDKRVRVIVEENREGAPSNETKEVKEVKTEEKEAETTKETKTEEIETDADGEDIFNDDI